MPIFCRKNVHSFRNAVLLCQFFQNFHQKPLAVMPIFDQKHQFYQNYTIIWAKKVNMMPSFFRFLTEKSSLSCPYFVKNVHSPKSTLLSSLDFVKKTAILSKTLCSYVIFSKFSWQTPCFQDLIWSKKRQYCQNNTIISAQNVYKDALFFQFFTKK